MCSILCALAAFLSEKPAFSVTVPSYYQKFQCSETPPRPRLYLGGPPGGPQCQGPNRGCRGGAEQIHRKSGLNLQHEFQ